MPFLHFLMRDFQLFLTSLMRRYLGGTGTAKTMLRKVLDRRTPPKKSRSSLQVAQEFGPQ